MPAITVDDITVLPRIPDPDPIATRQRPVRTVTSAPRGFEGEGFPVRRAFHGVDLADLDPFVHMDQMGEVEYAPGEPKGTPWHPHRGFETVTYIMDGTFEHSDSNGGGGVITNGDTQWMTAGAGILHIEKPPEALVVSGGLFHGIQLWVNLPRELKWSAPRYQDLRAREVALVSSADGGALVRVIAGEVAGHAGPGSTYTPMTLVHATLSPGARLALPWRPDYNALLYVLAGHGTVGAERRPVETGQLAVFGPGDALTMDAAPVQESRSPNLDVLILGGRPIREPVAWMGPFVMNTRAEVIQAFEDYQAGRLGSIPAIHNAPTTLVESRAAPRANRAGPGRLTRPSASHRASPARLPPLLQDEPADRRLLAGIVERSVRVREVDRVARADVVARGLGPRGSLAEVAAEVEGLEVEGAHPEGVAAQVPPRVLGHEHPVERGVEADEDGAGAGRDDALQPRREPLHRLAGLQALVGEPLASQAVDGLGLVRSRAASGRGEAGARSPPPAGPRGRPRSRGGSPSRARARTSPRPR